jgi:hypothetical protein
MKKEEMKIRRYTPHTKEDCRRAAECIIELKQRIDKAIEILKLCNSQCAKETIAILGGKE